MCGIVGISGFDNAAEHAFLALYALQHRGQEASGIVTFDGTAQRSHKGVGLVSEVFDGETISRLRGNVAIGHTRYSTAGGNDVANAQPLTAHYARGNLALAHKAAGKPELARETLLTALVLSPDHAPAHYNLAVLYDQAGERALAVEHYRAFLEHRGDEYTARAADARERIAALDTRR